jgi:ACS family hexuronate transporter-like MFS transporter
MVTAVISSPLRRPSSPGRFRWVIVGLLFGATTIGYIDRFLLGMLKPTLCQSLHFTERDYANVVFYFQLAYAIGLVTVSRVIDAVGTRAGMALVVFLCALASASHSLATTVAGFCLARFALGFAEAGTWPGCMKTISEWLPRKERSIGAGLINAGSSVGATVTPLVVPVLLALIAWRFSFLCTATLDLLWFAAWLAIYRRPGQHPRLSPPELAYIQSDASPPQPKVPWLGLFRYRQTWAFLIAKGLSDPVWWFFLFWVPGFLAGRYAPTAISPADSARALAFPVMVIYLMASAGSIGGGWLATRLITHGWSVNAARKTVMLGCALCVSPVVLVCFGIGLWPSALLIGLAAAAHLGFSANLFTVATDTVPQHVVSSVAGIGGLAAAIGGMIVAKAVGFILGTTHSYLVPFALSAAVYFVALGILQLLLPRLESMQVKESR